MKNLVDKIGPRFEGHVIIRDKKTGEIIRDVYNAINAEALSYALALALADRTNGHIQSMVFGNGGSNVTAVGTVTYQPPNVLGLDASLYNQTYSKVVDDQSPLNLNPSDNFMTVNHVAGAFYSDVQITCTLEYNEPSEQSAYDDVPVADGNVQNTSGTGPDVTGTYIFDELGLTTYDATTGASMLISHVIFHPVQKALNRAIEILYTIRLILS